MTPRFIVVMGVAGCGKTTVGRALADKLGWDFFDADDFHPPANIAKMRVGIPLDDSDRAPWLAALRDLISTTLAENKAGVLACSALKESYRRQLVAGNSATQLVYLKGDYDLISARLAARTGHYMQPNMLRSQFDALEEPRAAWVVDVQDSVDEIVEKIMAQMNQGAQVGVIGLGVMGRSLALNMARRGYRVAGYDSDAAKVSGFRAADESPIACDTLAAFVAALETPRQILMMVPAGKPVDAVIESLAGQLSSGDLLMDGGNSFFTDTERRVEQMNARGLLYLGVGVSGGEQGALTGPAIMPGGSRAGWERARPLLEAIAARYESIPCAAYIGPGGAGHYVKMVHNGIEYADMQLIAEIYDFLRRGLGMSAGELADVFEEWNAHELRSYLIEITARILQRTDPDTGRALVDVILDEAAQKGTGRWASQNAFDLGAPIPTINAAVESRLLSSLKAERVTASERFRVELDPFNGARMQVVRSARAALYAGKIISYAQGFGMLRAASIEYKYDLNLAAVANIWRAGCIIRADLLTEVAAAFARQPEPANLLLDDFFRTEVLARHAALRETLQVAISLGIPMLALSSALAYFDAYRSDVLPANLTQAQRDFFGTHTYRRTDRTGSFHTNWEE